MSSTSPLLRRAPLLWGIALTVAACLTFGTAAQANAEDFRPNYILSNANMRDYDCMSQAAIQAFLETQPGPLKSLVTADYDQVITLSKTKSNVNTTPDKGETPKPASRIIWEACQAWKISPKVMLTMLQKEQSLLTRTSLGSTTLSRAVGAGCPGSLVFPKTNPVATNRYPGFGNQIWHGARLLDGYGEGKNGSTIPLFKLGIRIQIYRPTLTSRTWELTKRWWNSSKRKYEYEYHLHLDGTTYFKRRIWSVKSEVYKSLYYIGPADLATYKFYVYNPSIGASAPYRDLSTQECAGNANFWKIYRKHFGGTYSNPRMHRVFRFWNRNNGTNLYTSSPAERYHLAAKHRSAWGYGGVAFSMDTSVTTTSTVPVYRFYNMNTHKYSFIRSSETYAYRRSAAGRKTWRYGGIAFRVSGSASTTSVPVYRMYNRRSGANLLTSSKSKVDELRSTATLRRAWAYKGITFYMPRFVAR